MNTYTISVGKSRKDVSWKVRDVTWDQLTGRLSKVLRTSETTSEYFAMSKDRQSSVKDIGGFVGGPVSQDGPEGGRRKAGSVPQRSLVTLDADSVPEGTDIPSVIERALPDTAFYAYTTHTHTMDAPRWRVVIPLTRPVTADEYGPVVRRLCERAGMSLFDKTCVQPERLMYWPSCPSDGEPDSADIEGNPLDPDNVLASYLDWHDASEWPQFPGEFDMPKARKGGRAEDPTRKDNIVGTFCRAYDIHQAISKFLPTVYRRNATDKNRYTYVAGHTSNGFVVYDGGKFAYSNHGTDPVSGMMVNAFDLVRIHLFSSYDSDPDKPVNRQPSWERMEALVQTDDGCVRQRARDEARKNADAFGDVNPSETPETGPNTSEAKKQGKNEVSVKGPVEGPKSWMEEKTSELVWDKKGLADSVVNVRLILENDPRVKGAIQFNEFTSKAGVTGELPWHGAPKPGTVWDMKGHVPGLKDWLECNYRPFKKENVTDAVTYVSQLRSYHPVRDYLDTLTWDGTPRLERLFIDYLGATDTRLNRLVARKAFTAAVARIYEPGTKFDGVPVLSGPEGIGKSSLCSIMGSPQWTQTSLITVDGPDSMVYLQGKWIVEMAEMSALKKSSNEKIKDFLSRSVDSFRAPYGSNILDYPRKCIFIITTNERNFLLGETGNRRMWIVQFPADPPLWTKDKAAALEANRDQLWAEARHYYRHGERLYFDPGDESAMRDLQMHRNEAFDDPRLGEIEQWLELKVPVFWHNTTSEWRRGWTLNRYEAATGTKMVPHEYTCPAEILRVLYDVPESRITRWEGAAIRQMLTSLGWAESAEMRHSRFDKAFGRQRWFRRPIVSDTSTDAPEKTDVKSENWEDLL